MLWRKKRQTQQPDVQFQPPTNSRVEIEVEKNASSEVTQKAKEVNEHVNKLLVENGFTLKIYLAAHNPNGRPNQGRT